MSTTVLLAPGPFSQESATLEGETHHHLFRVKRLQAGESLRVVDGYGAARVARIASIDKRRATLALGEPAPANEPSLRVELYVAMPKPERAAWLVEKATELGVASIRFLDTEREARDLSTSQLERLRRVAISAVEQCGRSVLPEIVRVGELSSAIAQCRANRSAVSVLDATGERSPRKAGPAGHALFIGPEGGWSSAERSGFLAESVSLWALGPTVLRVETAAIAAASIVLAGD